MGNHMVQIQVTSYQTKDQMIMLGDL